MAVVALLAFALVFCLGGLAGVAVAGTLDHRVRRMVDRSCRVYDVFADAYERGGPDGVKAG